MTSDPSSTLDELGKVPKHYVNSLVLLTPRVEGFKETGLHIVLKALPMHESLA